MENRIQQENRFISAILLGVFVSDKILDYDGSVDSLKLNVNGEINFIYRPEILEDYLYVANNFFQSLTLDKDLEVDDLKCFVQSLFEEHLECFILTLKKMLKNEITSFNNFDFIIKFTGTYFSKYLTKEYILERLVFKFNDDNLLSKYSFLKPYLNNTTIPHTDFDTDIFKNETGFLIFKDYYQLYIVNEYKDFGFIFQSLKEDKLIHNIRHIDFAKWLSTKKYITQEIYNEIDLKKGFESLNKLTNAARLNSYINLREKHLK
ncbi:hypothetical protein [Chryseobacterium binzhouense]|uniref:hypothetical protein n=1 Tax=Chryseobacterium binzhouense TaxID=2593646 RepID=UPI00117E0544|nr:hypothetical protein [Chryseobacterium binzhouense]